MGSVRRWADERQMSRNTLCRNRIATLRFGVPLTAFWPPEMPNKLTVQYRTDTAYLEAYSEKWGGFTFLPLIDILVDSFGDSAYGIYVKSGSERITI